MLFLPISIGLLSLAILVSLFKKDSKPQRTDILAVIIFIGQVFAFLWLIKLQRSIGCSSVFGSCYEQHEDLLFLQDSKTIFALISWVYWFFLGGLIFLRTFKFFRKN